MRLVPDRFPPKTQWSASGSTRAVPRSISSPTDPRGRTRFAADHTGTTAMTSPPPPLVDALGKEIDADDDDWATRRKYACCTRFASTDANKRTFGGLAERHAESMNRVRRDASPLVRLLPPSCPARRHARHRQRPLDVLGQRPGARQHRRAPRPPLGRVDQPHLDAPERPVDAARRLRRVPSQRSCAHHRRVAWRGPRLLR
ncbi:MAG: hypothetical protein JWR34_6163 [Mycobacterium sp.]|nr:hypothetical protein [Mycobacterium sp.]